jgi:hypothetical protein
MHELSCESRNESVRVLRDTALERYESKTPSVKANVEVSTGLGCQKQLFMSN